MILLKYLIYLKLLYVNNNLKNTNNKLMQKNRILRKITKLIYNYLYFYQKTNKKFIIDHSNNIINSHKQSKRPYCSEDFI